MIQNKGLNIGICMKKTHNKSIPQEIFKQTFDIYGFKVELCKKY